MKKLIRIMCCMFMSSVLCMMSTAAFAADEFQNSYQNETAGMNLLVNPDWENGIEGWDILADSRQEVIEGRELLCSIIYQDVPAEDYMYGKAARLSGSIAVAPEDPTQEKIVLSMTICAQDGYVVDGTADDGSFIYDKYTEVNNTDLTEQEIVIDIPDEAAFIRISMEIRKLSPKNAFNFKDLKLEIVEKEVKEDNPFVRAAGAQNQPGPDTQQPTESQPQTQQPQSDPESLPAQVEMYTFSDRNGVEYSVPVDLFAQKVLSYDTGTSWTTVAEQQDPELVLGIPFYDESAEIEGDYCMGSGGEIVLGFGKALYDGPGTDIFVFEAGSNVEEVKVEVSNDRITWYEIGTASTIHGDLDMQGMVPEGSSFQYVRLTDFSHVGGTWPGADIYGVCGFYGRQIEQNSQAEPSGQIGSSDDAYFKALVEEGKGYYYGTGPEGYNRDKAQQCFYEAAQGHYGEGWYYYGNLLMNSIEDQRYERAMGCYEKACEYGFDLGLVGQAVLYENGLGTDTDYTKAFELYTKAYQAGFAEGYCGLGGLYEYGNAVVQDETAAMEYYKMALTGSDFMWRNYARCQIAKMYKKNYPGIGQDYSLAFDWFMQAADEGYGSGYLGIGDMYFSGEGADKDRAQALTWYKKAAAHGNVTGMYDAAFMLDHEIGVPQDYQQAFEYYMQAANLGDADAMYALGCMYESGHGTGRDYAQARYWLELAVEFTDDISLKESIGEELAYIASEGY